MYLSKYVDAVPAVCPVVLVLDLGPEGDVVGPGLRLDREHLGLLVVEVGGGDNEPAEE